MGRNVAVIGCFVAAMISVAVGSGTIVPVAYGVGEQTTGVTATGIVSTITALLTSAGGIFALFRKGETSEAIRRTVDLGGNLIGGLGGNSQTIRGIKDATELLPLIAKNEGGIEASAVRVAIFTLEVHCAIRQPDKLDQVHALAKALLVMPQPEPLR
jgi:hypothetical protein